jgi:polysaccharide deacetylase family protein (PEP-CTERM system associated)
LAKNKEILEHLTGDRVAGFRAPSFSIGRKTAWAIDELVEMGFSYDSSIYPVRHDRYGIAEAPRGPFVARGLQKSIIELPPATLRLMGMNLPVGGGGYFRLFPTPLVDQAVTQARTAIKPPIVTLYFHPWEFDPGQARLPFGWVKRFRTYAGIFRNRARFSSFVGKHLYSRAVDAARHVGRAGGQLPSFGLTG